MPTRDQAPPARVVWISWERHRRSRELAAALAVPLLEIVPAWRRPWSYLPAVWQTCAVMLRRRPDTVIAQCPSVVLALVLALLGPWLRFALVLDLHNEAVEPFNFTGRPYRSLLAWLWRRADLCVVSNDDLAPSLGGHAKAVCVLPDRVPGLDRAEAQATASLPGRAVFICTYAADEPYSELIEAARLVRSGVEIAITGNSARATLPADLPDNVRICGFLPEADYERLLREADLLIDLTAMEKCLVCGAYEAVALGKPLVTSDTHALRTYFDSGTIYSRHTPEALARAIDDAFDSRQRLGEEMRALRPRLEADWAGQLDRFRQALVTVSAPRSGERLAALDGLRFVAASAVLVYHYVSSYAPRLGASSWGWVEAAAAWTRYGYLGVNLFFMISGFVILWSSAARPPAAFAIGRFTRLYPTFWTALALTSAATVWLGTAAQSTVITAPTVAANATMLPSVFGAPRIDDVYWTLEVELYFYVLVFAVLCVRQMRNVERLVWAWLALITVQVLYPQNYVLNRLTLAPYGSYFAAGCLFYLVYSRGSTWSRSAALVWAAALAISQSIDGRASFITPDAVSGVIVPALVASFFGVMWIVAVWRPTPPLASQLNALGALTYPLYLTHAGIGVLVIQSLPGSWGVGTRVVFVTVLALVLAALLAVTVDRVRTPLARGLTAAVRRIGFEVQSARPT